MLDRFRGSFPDFPKGRIIRSESPDFILKQTPKKSIGIEIMALPSARYDLNGDQKNRLIEDIVMSVSKKEEKLVSYRKKWAGAYWLGLYADLIDNKGIDLWVELTGRKLRSNFDHVFVFDLFEGKIWDFPLKQE